MGRKSSFSERKAQKVCKLLATGLSLNKICEGKGMPAPSTVIDWAHTNPVFAEQYARARKVGYEVKADEILDVAWNDVNDMPQSLSVQRDKLKIDALKWVLSKMLPKQYGDTDIQPAQPQPIKIVFKSGKKPARLVTGETKKTGTEG